VGPLCCPTLSTPELHFCFIGPHHLLFPEEMLPPPPQRTCPAGSGTWLEEHLEPELFIPPMAAPTWSLGGAVLGSSDKVTHHPSDHLLETLGCQSRALFKRYFHTFALHV
jgi:hypothetical protein